ncbi:hypothetical protein [Caldinitratiruptor microaerophilus]|uniref:Uncharacterized protein n=1 Tax=Caldinitratiruptor microaerophilus TaxID=671077 RepID=A0AA35CMX5_9FIRM|nr:hypothetical protein [Caldinitratiruptor microaerophilus]BDG60235.1 hypothetical protein caldi_13250 [Caldinitratiruptor microaerophilus]
MHVQTVLAEFRWRGDAELAAAHLAEAYGWADLEVRVVGPEDRDAMRMAWGESGPDVRAITYWTGMTAAEEPEAPADTALLVARTAAADVARQAAVDLRRSGALAVHVTETP